MSPTSLTNTSPASERMLNMMYKKYFFTYSSYVQWLRYAIGIAPICPLGEYSEKESCILLRHDEDLSIEYSYAMFLVEKKEKIRSSYYFLTTSETYNLLTRDSRKKIKEMSDEGFEIGLHFDPTVYNADTMNDEDISNFLFKKAKYECSILEDIIDREIRSISLHNPSVHGRYEILPGYVNSYDPKFFRDDIYISDSRMDFRNKDIFNFIERAKETTIQVLIHPFHYNESLRSFPEILEEYIHVMTNKVHSVFSVNSTYMKQCPEGLTRKIFRER